MSQFVMRRFYRQTRAARREQAIRFRQRLARQCVRFAHGPHAQGARLSWQSVYGNQPRLL